MFHLQHELHVDQLGVPSIHGKISMNILPLLDIWNKLFFPNFLNTLPLISTNCWRGENRNTLTCKTNTLMPQYICDFMYVFLLTLLDIMMVSRDLLCELKATLRVDAWIMMRMVWKTEQQPLRKITEINFNIEYHNSKSQWNHTLAEQIKQKGKNPAVVSVTNVILY